MCGIVGVILHGNGGFLKRSEDSFFELLYVDALRGMDSTGVIAVEHNGAYHTAKEATEATWFVPQIKGGDIGKKMWNTGKAYIGHNRKKTIGKVEDATAHPFVIDDTFAMVHNGTLYNHKALAETDVDSHALAIVLKQALEQENQKEALEETLGKVNGAYAVVMYDQKGENIHFLRNKERPLWFINTPESTFFASEAMMASWVLTRNGYTYSTLKFEEVKEHVLYTYNLVSNKWSEMELKPKKATPSMVYTGPWTGTGIGGKTSSTGSDSDKKVTKQVFKFFRRKHLGSRVSFWADDVIEDNYPLTIENGETDVILFAKTDDVKHAHTIAAIADLSKCGITTREEIFEVRWSGIVSDIEWGEDSESVIIHIEDAKPVMSSKQVIEGTEKYVVAMLSKKSLEEIKEDFEKFKDHLSNRVYKIYEDTIKERENSLNEVKALCYAAGYDAVFEEADKEGVKLLEERKNGKLTLTHPTKGIVYEAPIVVH